MYEREGDPEIDKEVYMEQPEGFVDNENEHMVCRLKTALYGLKQAPRTWYWYIHINTFLQSLGFVRSTADINLYIRHNNQPVYLLLWVDDMLICSPSRLACNEIKQQLKNKYKMKDLGLVRMFVKIEIIRDRQKHTIFLHQHRYIDRILKLFNMHKSNMISILLDLNSRLYAKTDNEEGAVINDYQQRVGKLMYAMLGTRLDLAYIVSTLGRFNANLSLDHAGVLKRTLRYLRHTQDHG